MGVVIRHARKSDSREFLRLLVSLAVYEKLEPPSAAARNRIIDDVFRRRIIRLIVAEDGGSLVGYGIYYFTYSSFLARRTLYLEDIYVPESQRRRGVGGLIFRWCADEAVKKGCGRMEWSVLTWNKSAIRFYEKVGAVRLDDWYVYRLTREALTRLGKGVEREKKGRRASRGLVIPG